MQIRKAKEEDITAVAALYDAVCDTLEAGENYPGWAKGDYPTRRDAEMGEAAGELFVTEEAGEILGTMMLREEQERNARSAPWQLPLEEQEQLTIYTFAVPLSAYPNPTLCGERCSFKPKDTPYLNR